jgi:hypothetical protein
MAIKIEKSAPRKTETPSKSKTPDPVSPKADLVEQEARTQKVLALDARVYDTARYCVRVLVDIWGAAAVQTWLDELK